MEGALGVTVAEAYETPALAWKTAPVSPATQRTAALPDATSSSPRAASPAPSKQYAMAPAPLWAKWWVLLWYSYLSALQSLLWMTYSSVPTSSETYLGVDEATLNIMLAYGPIAFCLAVYPAAALLSSRPLDGLRLTIRLGAAMCLTAAILRTIPVLISSRADAADAAGHDSSLALTHVAQFINAAVGPLIVASPAVLSRAWFPPAQRNTATAVANTANALGRAVGFFLGPALVSTASQLPVLLVVTLVCSAVPAIAVFVWLPNPPPRLHAHDGTSPADAAPAASARAVLLLDGGVQADTFYYDGLGGGGGGKAAPLAESESNHADGGGVCGSAGSVARQACAGLRSASFCLVALSGGSTMAVWGAWSGVLPAVMSPQFSADQAGAVGSVATFASIAGGIATGLACDHPLLRARLRVVTIAACLAASLGFWVLAAALPPIAAPALASRITFWPILAVVAFAGGVRGGGDPLYFEMIAAVGAPLGVPAGTAGGLLTFFYHLVLAVCLLAPPSVMNWSMTAMAVVCVLSAALLVPAAVPAAAAAEQAGPGEGGGAEHEPLETWLDDTRQLHGALLSGRAGVQ